MYIFANIHKIVGIKIVYHCQSITLVNFSIIKNSVIVNISLLVVLVRASND